MARFLEIVVAFLLVAALGVVVALFLPSHRSYTHAVETNRPINVVFDMLNGFQRFNDWNHMKVIDPNVQFTLSGPASGVGARLEFRSSNPRIGSGSWEIIESVPGERIVFALDTPTMGHNKTMRFRFERTGRQQRNVEISKRYRVEYGWNLIGRFAGIYVASNMGRQVQLSLRTLNNALAGIPRVDYTLYPHPFEVVDLPARNVLQVEVQAPLADDGVAVSMTNQRQWMDRVMAANNLVADGPLRIVTLDRSSESYTFIMQLPVRDAEAPEGASSAPSVAELPALQVAITGEGNTVTFAQTPPLRAASTKWIGPAPGLQRVRDTIRAWALVRGLVPEPGAQGFDDYRVAIADMLGPEAEFQAFVPLAAATAPLVAAAPAAP
ncbi:MAG: polyketide cyclase [Xanthomonadaceae bacterium]|jgi:uncharacterized protein YndB with AHSA1/START domain|nr:polyketide cyclase [Xanthomonadaceae bacterium]